MLTVGANNGTAPNAVQTLTLTVNEAPVITLHPSAQTVNAGNTASFTAAATGFPVPTVRWQVSEDGGTSYGIVNGATAPTLGFSASQSENGFRFRAVFSNSEASVTTTPARLTVGTAPTISTAAAATFGVTGQAQSFPIVASGVPDATFTTSGTLPGWLTLVDDGAGRAHVAATPPAGSGGVHTFTIRASNGFSPTATQVFTLTVNESPTITSPDAFSLTTGTAGNFVVTTTVAFPAATAISVVGSLPLGLSFTDNGDGTATLAGTATVGSGGSYPLTVTATNGVLTDAVQTLTLTVKDSPVITTQPVAVTVHSATAVTFSAAAVGYPAPSVQWQVSTDAGSTFADIAGATTATLSFTASQGQNGNEYRAVFTNAASAMTDAVRLTVGTPPTFTSGTNAEFTVGTARTVTAVGSPAPALTLVSGPSWLSFTNNGDGTATLAGTPLVGSGGEYPVTVTADNGFTPTASQVIVITVTETPSITSAGALMLAVAEVANFTVTTSGGFPAAVSLQLTGILPSGLTFIDNADGTATIAGAPLGGRGGIHSVTVSASNASGLTTEQILTLTVTEPVGITSESTATFIHGVSDSFTVTTSGGFPAAATLSVTGALPDGLAFVDNGDGTATLSGAATMTPGTVSVVVTSSNGVTDAAQTLVIGVTAAPVVALPVVVPSGDGALTGVPSTSNAGTQLDVVARGFAPGAIVTFGIYSTPLVLGTSTADASGTARMTVTIPSSFTGSHTIVATGIAPDGSERFLTSAVTVVGPTAVVDAAAAEAAAVAAAKIASTGVPYNLPVVSLLGALMLLAGVFISRRARRRA